jgi:hypothetical protein
MSNKALARAVRETSARAGHPVSCDHTAVSRWLDGTRPRRRTAQYVADALGAKLGRAVPPSEIGFPPDILMPESLGIEYVDHVDQAAAVLRELWRADQEEVRTVVTAPTVASAWPNASLNWLVRTGPDAMSHRPAGARVGTGDIQRLQATVGAFAAIDDRFGGGHARRALVQYLRSEVPSLMAGRYDVSTGRSLHAAVAEGTLLAAWMSYDAGAHGLAQRYFIQALRLAHAADDALLGGSVLDAMSHQATFLGRYREAATLARAARQGTTGRATPTLTAHFHAMEARALAAGGDSASAQRVLSDAVRVFERRQPGEDPDWFSYFDDAELAAEFAHCFRDTGRFTDAVTYAERGMTGSARSDFFVTMVLATGHLGTGDVDQACEAARRALDLGTTVRSARCAEYIRAFRQQLGEFEGLAVVRDLHEYAADHPLWLPSSAAA